MVFPCGKDSEKQKCPRRACCHSPGTDPMHRYLSSCSKQSHHPSGYTPKQAPASVNHWQEPVHFLKFRHPQTMEIAVGVDRHRLFGAQFKHRLGRLPGGKIAELSHKNPFQKISPSLSSAFTSSTLRHEQRKMSPCHRHGKGESPQGTTKQPLHEPASLLA